MAQNQRKLQGFISGQSHVRQQGVACGHDHRQRVGPHRLGDEAFAAPAFDNAKPMSSRSLCRPLELLRERQLEDANLQLGLSSRLRASKAGECGACARLSQIAMRRWPW